MWRKKWATVNNSDLPKTSLETLQHCILFPNIQILLQIFSTSPISIATAERTFSSLKLIKSYLRNTMQEDRLNGLALLYVHQKITY